MRFRGLLGGCVVGIACVGKFAARALRQGISTPWGERWRCRALAASRTSSLSVRTLTSHFTWSISPTMIAADLDESLEAAPRLSTRQWRAELEQFRSCPNVGVSPFVRYALDGDREAILSLCRDEESVHHGARAALARYSGQPPQ
jgi:hypothetical protein